MNPFAALVRAAARLLVVLATALCLAASTASAVHAQDLSASIKGNVLDPDGKAVVDAIVMIRDQSTGETKATTTDGAGTFVSSALRAATYAIEVAVPGFDIVRRTGVTVRPGTAEAISIQLTVANVSETVTVSAALPQAAVAAPSQGSLTARSAQSLISNEYIRNYTSPFSDFSQVLQMAPGTFSTSANGPGLGDTKDVLSRLQRRLLQHVVRQHPVQRHQRPDPSLLGILPGPDDRFHRVRSKSRISRVDRTVHIRRIREPAVAITALAPAGERHTLDGVVQHQAV